MDTIDVEKAIIYLKSIVVLAVTAQERLRTGDSISCIELLDDIESDLEIVRDNIPFRRVE